MVILRIIFYIVIFGLLAVLFVFLFLASAIRNLRNKAQQQPHANQGRHTRQATQADGNVVIDRRPTDEIGKKIIPKDEGEYVDYEDA